MKKFRHAFFPAFLEILVTDFKPAGDLCVAVDATGNFKGVWGACPPAFEENLEKKSQMDKLYIAFIKKKSPIFCIHILSLPED